MTNSLSPKPPVPRIWCVPDLPDNLFCSSCLISWQAEPRPRVTGIDDPPAHWAVHYCTHRSYLARIYKQGVMAVEIIADNLEEVKTYLLTAPYGSMDTKKATPPAVPPLWVLKAKRPEAFCAPCWDRWLGAIRTHMASLDQAQPELWAVNYCPHSGVVARIYREGVTTLECTVNEMVSIQKQLLQTPYDFIHGAFQNGKAKPPAAPRKPLVARTLTVVQKSAAVTRTYPDNRGDVITALGDLEAALRARGQP